MPPLNPARNPLAVLVVDDEPDIRELLSEHLRARGHRVSMASDGRAAITALERAPSGYELLITDLHLPGADGLAVLQAARALNPSLCVVIITGFASLDSAIQAVRHGAYDYLTKPFSLGQIDVLAARVQERLALENENRRLLRQIGERGAEPAHPVRDRLTVIEERLELIERLVREILARTGA